MVPKKASKSKPSPVTKPIEKPISKTKKNKKKNYENFSIYIYKLLRSVTSENIGISRKSILIMNNFIYDMIEKIAMEGGKLVSRGKKYTLTSRDIQSAVKLVIPGELYKHANTEAAKALSTYYNSRENEAKVK